MELLGRINFTFIVAMLGLFFIASPAAAQSCEFDEWDSNDDSFLDEDEFGTAFGEVGYYDDWDDDDDDTLSESEWEMGIDERLGAYDSGVYSDWDINGDGNLSESEFREGLFDLIDDNNDGQIGDDDWELFTDEDDGLFC
ncbi:MAG TPA: hypothetical protein VF181_09885 [Balneolaceae bacterium]